MPSPSRRAALPRPSVRGHQRWTLIMATTMALLLPAGCRGFLARSPCAAAAGRLLPHHAQQSIALAGLRSISSGGGFRALYMAASESGDGGSTPSGSAAPAAATPTGPTAAGQTGPKAAAAPAKKQQQQQQPKPKPARPPRGTNMLIVGLGNPGKEYAQTRHNAGFLVVDELARRLGADLKLRSAFQGEYGSATYKGKSVGLLKPTTFMNNSGQSVRKVLDYFKLPFSAVLVVVDEVALELGQIRLRQTGSPGGHNGLKSIEGHLKTKDYHRLRIGVGGAAPGKMVDHVLGEFSRSEKRLLEEVMFDSCEAVEAWIEEDDTDKVMNRVNAPR